MHDFQWDEHNQTHVRRHGVDPYEAEEALADRNRIDAQARPSGPEQRFAFIGATEAGRLLVVVLTYRADSLRVVTSRDATGRERRRYQKRGR